MSQFDMFVGNGLLFVFVLIEAAIIKFYLKKELPIKELIMNLNSGHILLWILRGLEVAAYIYTFHKFSFMLLETTPIWVVWIFAFFLWDFMFYWLHRTHHLWKILWSIHVVHHEGEHFSLSLGTRNSWYSSLSSFPYFIVMALIGIRPEIFIAVSSIHYMIQFYNHNHLVKKSGFLELFMITPAHHRVHHGKNDPYIDKNFGGTFSFWDKLFGTFQLEDAKNPVQIGILNPVKSNNPIQVNNVPFKQMIDESYEYNSKTKERIIPNHILISGALLLFSMLLAFILYQHQLDKFYVGFLFSTIFLGTLSNGFVLDGNSFSIPFWFLSNILAPIFLLFNFQLATIGLNVLIGFYLIHGIYNCLYLIKNKA